MGKSFSFDFQQGGSLGLLCGDCLGVGLYFVSAACPPLQGTLGGNNPYLAATVASAGVRVLIVRACTPPLISSSSRPYTSWCRLIIGMASNLAETTSNLRKEGDGGEEDLDLNLYIRSAGVNPGVYMSASSINPFKPEQQRVTRSVQMTQRHGRGTSRAWASPLLLSPLPSLPPCPPSARYLSCHLPTPPLSLRPHLLIPLLSAHLRCVSPASLAALPSLA